MTTDQFGDQPYPTDQPHAKPTAQQWVQAFERTENREPTMAEYQSAVAADEIAPEPKRQDPSLQQMGTGFKQVAADAKGLYDTRVAPAVQRSGAKEFYTGKVAPAAKATMSSAQQAACEHDRKTQAESRSQVPVTGAGRWTARAPYILPAVAFLTIFALFLPIVSAMGLSANYFNEEIRGEGIFLLLVMLATIAVAVLAIIRSTRGARLASGIAGVVAGIIAMVDGFGTMIMVSGQLGASVAVGLILLVLLSVVMAAAGVLILGSLRRTTSAAPRD